MRFWKLTAVIPFVFLGYFTSFGATFSWKSVNLQGMGYVSGIVAHTKPPYDLYVRTDVGGIYRLDRGASRWIPLLDKFDTADIAQAVDSIAIDPTNPNVIYASVQWYRARLDASYAEVLVSRSGGRYWSTLDLAPRQLSSTASAPFGGTTGERLAVDPLEPQRIYYASEKDGLWVKKGPEDWYRVKGLPQKTDQPGISFVLCHPETGHVYAGVWSIGVFMSPDHGANWSKIIDIPNPSRAAFAPDGTFYVAGGGSIDLGTGGRIKRLQKGVLTDVTPSQSNDLFSGVTIDPSNPNVVVVSANYGMRIFRSTDQGKSWKQIPATDAKQPGYYLEFSKSAACCNSTVFIDPAKPKRLYALAGYGLLRTEDMTLDAPSWEWFMNNLEELVVSTVKVPPLEKLPNGEAGADLLSGVADVMGFRHASRDVVPAKTFPSFEWVAQANSIAYCATKPEFTVFVGWDHPTKTTKTGYSTDNGKTWTPIPDSTPGVSGNIAMSATNPQNLVWAPIRPAPVVYSTDGGRTWQKSRLGSGSTPLPLSWQLGNVWWSAQVLSADLVKPNTFYYYANGDFYSSSDGGATWDKKSTITTAGTASVPYTITVTVIPNPAKAGDIWIAFARNPNQAIPFRLLHSTDGGANFSVVESLASANFVGFGKGKSPSEPYIYVHGKLTPADYDTIYKSEDSGQTWIPISDPALNQFGSITFLEGDMRTRDLVYAGTSGRGILYGHGPDSGIQAPSISAALPALDLEQTDAVVPGETLTLWGTDLGPEQPATAQSDETEEVSTLLAGTQVFFDAIPAPVLSASSGKVEVLAPQNLNMATRTRIQVSYQGRLSIPFEVPVIIRQTAPGSSTTTP